MAVLGRLSAAIFRAPHAAARAGRLHTAARKHSSYTVQPCKGGLGAEVVDLDFTAVGEAIIPKAEIASDLDKFKVLFFRNQPASFATGEVHCSVARGLGIVDEREIFDNPKSPRAGVYRISNNPSEGKWLYQASWWHTDGLVQPMPVRFTSLYMVEDASPPDVTYGTTKFVPAHRFYHEQDDRTKERWMNRYWLRDVGSDATYTAGKDANRMSPLVYTHPSTGEIAISVETPEEGAGFVDWVDGSWVVADPDSSKGFIEELQLKLDAACASYGYEHRWQQGDFMMWDNMAVIHKADSDAYLTAEMAREHNMPYYQRTLQRVTILTETQRDKQPSKEVEEDVIHGKAELVERLLTSKGDFTHLRLGHLVARR